MSNDKDWIIPKVSGSQGTCVAAKREDGKILVANSRDLTAGQVQYTPEEWAKFIAAVKDGEYDTLLD